jgi:Copper transport outer membrane protein, MctB
MVSFRFHLVSLVAVFLALGLGVLVGTTVINRGIVRGLEDQTDRLVRDNSDLREQVAELTGLVETLGTFGEAVFDHVVNDRLTTDEVVIVTQEGTDEAAIGAARGALERAGADMLGLLTVSDRMALADEASRDDLEAIVGGSSPDEAEVLTAEAAQGMASELAFGPVGGDMLPELIREEFVLVGGRELQEGVLRGIDGDEAVVVVAGGRDEPVVDPARFLVPLIEGLVEDGARVAAAEGLQTRYPFVTLLREDGAVTDEIATQDNVDQVPGEVGLVLGVEDMLRGVPGHYGVKDGASRLLPPP